MLEFQWLWGFLWGDFLGGGDGFLGEVGVGWKWWKGLGLWWFLVVGRG